MGTKMKTSENGLGSPRHQKEGVQKNGMGMEGLRKRLTIRFLVRRSHLAHYNI